MRRQGGGRGGGRTGRTCRSTIISHAVEVRSLRSDDADTVVQSFEGPISKMILERDLLAFRFFSEGFSAIGRWLTTLGTALRIGDYGKPAIDALNLLISGNTATSLAPVLLPAGTTVSFRADLRGAPCQAQSRSSSRPLKGSCLRHDRSNGTRGHSIDAC